MITQIAIQTSVLGCMEGVSWIVDWLLALVGLNLIQIKEAWIIYQCLPNFGLEGVFTSLLAFVSSCLYVSYIEFETTSEWIQIGPHEWRIHISCRDK